MSSPEYFKNTTLIVSIILLSLMFPGGHSWGKHTSLQGSTSEKRNDTATKITNCNPQSCQNPVFSPDGQYILYTRFSKGYNKGPAELVKIKKDGTDEQIIVQADGSDNVCVPYGSWVGSKICFASDRAGGAEEIFIVNDDGTNIQQVTDHPEDEGYYIEPVFNPTNTDKIVFEYEPDDNSNHRIALLELEKDNKITLLTDGIQWDDRLPSWSKDGAKILFQRIKSGKDEGWDIYIADILVDETPILQNVHAIFAGNSDDTDCSWAFDDKYVLSSSNYGDLSTPNIYAFPSDGDGEPSRVTSSETNEDGAPCISPDNTWIAFESHYGEDEADPSELWIINATVSSSSQSWEDINDFVYQLQNIDLDAIGDTAFDLVVIDYAVDGSESGRFTAEETDALKNSAGGSKHVLAYMSIGEAENYRFYWEESWDADNDGQPGTGAPSWLGPSNPDWPGNYKVRYWEPEWQSIIFGSSTSYLDKIIESGFDGVYLDIIDAYEYWESGGESGEDRETAEQEMVDFVVKISEYAKNKNSNFGIFPQNGAALGAHEEYINAVTGIGQEDIYYGYDGDGQKTPRNVTQELEGYLDVFIDAGKLVLTIDYPFACSEDEPCFNKGTRKKINIAYRKSRKKGYIPYCTVRNLNYLTINPGHQPE